MPPQLLALRGSLVGRNERLSAALAQTLRMQDVCATLLHADLALRAVELGHLRADLGHPRAGLRHGMMVRRWRTFGGVDHAERYKETSRSCAVSEDCLRAKMNLNLFSHKSLAHIKKKTKQLVENK